MTSTLLVLLLSQAQGTDNPPAGATEPPLSAFPAGRWRYPARMELWTGLLLALALLSTGCVSLTPPPGRGTHLRYTHGEAAAPAWAQDPGEPSAPEPEGPQRLHRRQDARETVTAVGPGGAEEKPPGHHVMPQEFCEWFETRGFTGDMDIDQFCVKLELAHHQAIHGGGNWKLGRTWPGEWNRMIMKALLDAEARAGRMLTRNEILNIVAKAMEDYFIPMNFIPWRGP